MPERNRPDTPPRREDQDADLLLLSRISNEMVQAQKRYFGRGPTQAKSYLLDDFLLVVMRGGLTTAEATMLAAGREDLVRGLRLQLDDLLAERLIERMKELTGRPILSLQSHIHFNPDVVVKMFLFEPAAARLTVEGEGSSPG